MRSFGISDVGRRRGGNEDSWRASDYHGFYTVADGMGGHAAGEVASDLAVRAAFAHFAAQPPESDLERSAGGSVAAADRAVVNGATGRRKGMGSTIVVLAVRGSVAVVAHVGDSRVYLFSRRGGLRLLTTDHAIPNTSTITRALGLLDGSSPDVATHSVAQDDVFLLCSDGLTGPVTDREIERILAANARRGRVLLEPAARQLVDAANAAGGPDNITVLLAG